MFFLFSVGSKILIAFLQDTLHEKTGVDSRLIQVESELCSVRQVVVDQNTQVSV